MNERNCGFCDSCAEGDYDNCKTFPKTDYDRLKQERDELAAQVEVMREALMEAKTWNWLDEDPPPYEVLREVDIALSITPSAALREIQASTLEDAKEEFYGYKNHTSDEMFVDTAIELLDNLATAKRKGE